MQRVGILPFHQQTCIQLTRVVESQGREVRPQSIAWGEPQTETLSNLRRDLALREVFPRRFTGRVLTEHSAKPLLRRGVHFPERLARIRPLSSRRYFSDGYSGPLRDMPYGRRPIHSVSFSQKGKDVTALTALE